MSVLITRIVKINGVEEQRSTVVYEGIDIKGVQLPICTINPPIFESAKVEVELEFDPPLITEIAEERG